MQMVIDLFLHSFKGTFSRMDLIEHYCSRNFLIHAPGTYRGDVYGQNFLVQNLTYFSTFHKHNSAYFYTISKRYHFCIKKPQKQQVSMVSKWSKNWHVFVFTGICYYMHQGYVYKDQGCSSAQDASTHIRQVKNAFKLTDKIYVPLFDHDLLSI